MLRNIIGMSGASLERFNEIAGNSRSEIESSSDQDWSVSTAFAEDVVVRFALETPQFNSVFSGKSLTDEYSLSPAYYEALLNETKCASDPNQKGKSLEKLASYLFLLVPGWMPSRNVTAEKLTFETDIVVRNQNPSGGVTSEVFGRYFIAECKNWENPVGSRDVGYFLYKMHLTHASFGILFSGPGITGEQADERAAKDLIRRAFHEDSAVCIIISMKHLEQLLTKETTFRSLILQLSEDFRFGRARVRSA